MFIWELNFHLTLYSKHGPTLPCVVVIVVVVVVDVVCMIKMLQRSVVQQCSVASLS